VNLGPGDDELEVTDGTGNDTYNLNGGSNTTADPGDSIEITDEVPDHDRVTMKMFETVTGSFM
jgi:hypothetical protein